MTHQWHDAYRHQITPAHHLDPRSKLGVGLFLIASVLMTPHLSRVQVGGFAALIAGSAVLAEVSLRPLLKRVTALLPFAFLMLVSLWFSDLSWDHLRNILVKSVLSLAALMLLSLTTPFPDLLRALEQVRAPRLLTLFLAFLYRYGLVLREDAVQMERSWSARYFGKFWWQQWRRLGEVLTHLFLRSYERAERVFAAMQARGFSRQTPVIRLLHFEPADAVFLIAAVFLISWVRWGIV